MIQPRAIVQVTPPAAEPISLSLAKNHLRVDISDDDTLIGLLISAARQVAEAYTQRAFITQTLKALYPVWPDEKTYGTEDNGRDGLWIPSPPCTAVSLVKYYDQDGTEQTLDTSLYQVDLYSEPARIQIAPNQAWPILEAQKINPISVQFVTGYTDATAFQTAHPAIAIGMLKLIADAYKFREDNVTASIARLGGDSAAQSLFSAGAVRWGF